jgi:uncharacterized protein YihD (DUF1040 family)
VRDQKRIKRILKLLEQIWTKYPDLRLGQLIDNAVVMFSEKIIDIYELEDSQLEGFLLMYLKKVENER